MALTTVRSRAALAPGSVLAPERYDPRRSLGEDAGEGAARLGDVAAIERRTVRPADALGPCLVLDTSDVREGVVIARKPPVDGARIGSVKKVVVPGDVLVSRLRPYLRQVAYVDEAVPGADAARIVGSTEFFVLRPREERPIAFLVPFLLSSPVQRVLAAAQEGGHHPRFDEATLNRLPLPTALLDRRDEWSAAVRQSIALHRRAEAAMTALRAESERMLQTG